MKIGAGGKWLVVVVGLAAASWWALAYSRDPAPPPKLLDLVARLKPLHTPLGKTQSVDWLESHPEPGQTFEQYVRGKPVTAHLKHRVLYVQPLGEFTEDQRKIVTLTADCLGRYFGLPAKIKDDLPLDVIPDSARRTHPSWGVKQVLSTYVIDTLLPPRLPDDAAAYIAFTASDLWPGEGWNFVFGQASLEKRVGVWSIARNGDPGEREDGFRLCLLRTLKTATHETGHMFSIQHCTAYECNMCGSNNRDESDRRPLEVCPLCVAKICYATGVDPKRRFATLAEFCQEQGLTAEQSFYEKSLKALDRQR